MIYHNKFNTFWQIRINTHTGLTPNAEITGIYGISFWVVMINVILLQLIFYNRNKIIILFLLSVFISPWLFGYILLVQKICSKKGKKYVGAWNFSPSLRKNLQVLKFAKMIKKKMNSKSKIVIKKKFGKIKNKKIKVFESKDLSINSKKVYKFLNWSPSLSIENAVNLTVEWYRAFKKKQDLFYLTKIQILNYFKKMDSI